VSSGNFVSEQQRAVQAGLRQQRGGKFPSATREFGPLGVGDLSGPAGTPPVFPDDVRSGGRNAYLWSLGVVYDSGPLYGALAYELHNDTFGGSRNVPSALSNTSDRTGVRPSTGT